MGYSTNASKLHGVGDPGLFGSLFGIAKKVAGVAFDTSPAGRIFAAAKGAISPQAVPPPFTMPGGGVTATSRFIQQQVPKPGARGAVERFLPGGQTGFIDKPKRRRMNVLNVKALRRSTRRLAGFQREAKKVEKELRKLAPPARRRSSSAHIHHGHKH